MKNNLEIPIQEQLSNVYSSLNKEYNPKIVRLDLKGFIMGINNRYPWDLWWRNKHSVAFGSLEYKSANHIDMLIEYIEERHIEYLKKKKKEEEEDAENQSIGIGNGDKVKQIKMSKKEADEAFDNLDLNEFNI